jgi:toxin ParE1/3/4
LNYRVTFNPQAIRQLRDIERFLSGIMAPDDAEAFTETLIRFCENSLKTFPNRNRKRDDVAKGLRLLGYRKRATILYRVNDDKHVVTISAIYYGGQDWEAKSASVLNG